MTGKRASSSPRRVGRHRDKRRRDEPETLAAWAFLVLALVIFWSVVVWLVVTH